MLETNMEQTPGYGLDPHCERARELIKKIPEHDYIITAEAKGIPLVHEMVGGDDEPSWY